MKEEKNANKKCRMIALRHMPDQNSVDVDYMKMMAINYHYYVGIYIHKRIWITFNELSYPYIGI